MPSLGTVRRISSKNPDLFRAIPPKRILSRFGQVFAEGDKEVAARQSLQIAASSSEISFGRQFSSETCEETSLLEDNARHAAADKEFYASQQVHQIEAFVSHVWTASRWLKALALYYYMNIETAVIASVASWLSLMCVMVVTKGPMGMGGEPILLRLFVGVPMLVFTVNLFCGHWLRVPVQNLWIDKLCIHQTRTELYIKGVSSLPQVVANSERMIILLSSDYFERLWCNAELATFAAINKGAAQIDILPLWLAPSILMTLLLDVVGIVISNELFVWIPMVANHFAGTDVAETPGLITFLSLLFGVGSAFSVAYLPLVPATWHMLRAKIKMQEEMLARCAEYSLDKAKCTVESDRSLVEDLVKDLWNEAANPIQEFNKFVNEDLTHHLACLVGSPTSIPYRQCLLLTLPLTFSAAANVLGCDGMPCSIAAEAELGKGASTAQQMVTNSAAWAVGILGIYPTVYPVMLFLMSAARNRLKAYPCARVVAEVLTIIGSYVYMGFHEGFAAGLINAASSQMGTGAKESIWLWTFAVSFYLIVLVSWNRYLFK